MSKYCVRLLFCKCCFTRPPTAAKNAESMKKIALFCFIFIFPPVHTSAMCPMYRNMVYQIRCIESIRRLHKKCIYCKKYTNILLWNELKQIITLRILRGKMAQIKIDIQFLPSKIAINYCFSRFCCIVKLNYHQWVKSVVWNRQGIQQIKNRF